MRSKKFNIAKLYTSPCEYINVFRVLLGINSHYICFYNEDVMLRVLQSAIQYRVVRWKSIDVSEEHIASNFKVELSKKLA
jgi:hypothetical protein